ncbi:Kelch repeat-containing protein [Thermaurantiacus sp.]
MRRRDLLLAGLGAATLGAPAARAQWTPEPRPRPERPPVARARYRVLPPLPRPVQEIYPAFFDARIVVGGGFEAKGRVVNALTDLAPTAAVHAFRPGARGWDRLPDLPLPLHHPFLVAFAGRLLAIGGFTARGSSLWIMERRVFLLARGASRWEEGPPLPRPQAEVAGGIVGDRLVIAGGRTPAEAANANYADHGDTQDCWLLGPDLAGWTAGPPLPSAVNSAAFAALNGRLHVIGGRYSTGSRIRNVPVHQVLEPGAKAWVLRAPMPAARGGHAAAVAGGRIHTFGGESFEGTPRAHAEVFRYDPATDRWDETAPLPEPRHGLGAVAVAGRIHLLGGAEAAGGRATTASHLLFTPV